MSKQTQTQVPKPKPKPTEPTDAPTVDKKIARQWFTEQ